MQEPGVSTIVGVRLGRDRGARLTRSAQLAAVLLALAAMTAAAQRPSVSPRLAAALQRDSLHPVWLFARPALLLGSLRSWIVAQGPAAPGERWLHAVSAGPSAGGGGGAPPPG
jgi:hypothetical protein